MSVITEVRIAADEFELGRLIEACMGSDAVVELETVVPIGHQVVPYLQIQVEHLDPAIETARENPLVEGLRVVDDFGEQQLLAFDWQASEDPLFSGIFQTGVAVLGATGREGTWTFELRFDDYSALESFREYCDDAGVRLDLVRMYSPSSPVSDLSYGLTDPQREALVLAVERGYYDVPRRCTTAELAAELDISDQAVSERLRRGAAALVEHTIHPARDGGA